MRARFKSVGGNQSFSPICEKHDKKPETPRILQCSQRELWSREGLPVEDNQPAWLVWREPKVWAPWASVPTCEGNDVGSRGLDPFKRIHCNVDMGVSEVLGRRTMIYLSWEPFQTLLNFWSMNISNPNTVIRVESLSWISLSSDANRFNNIITSWGCDSNSAPRPSATMFRFRGISSGKVAKNNMATKVSNTAV